ncbi:sphinganine kinase lcb4 [Extremus antarcticus]|uniref:Sphinganine kinase lcb4 n=1 Tax=Extremus antarcticus TaxID=702011 RepID=A0AAJ0G4P4_9PEZI|nr:sphinganine kinase lcb4 [Extremus antarcticus]
MAMPNTPPPSNPFSDSADIRSDVSGPAASSDDADTLTVDRNATLTLGTDALIVLDEGLRHRRKADNCCGLLPQLAKTTQAIPFYNVLWAELEDFEVTIKYARSTGKNSCNVGTVSYTVIDKSLRVHAERWVERLLERAYPPATKRRRRVKVLVNPFGGQGYAAKLWQRDVEPIFAAAKSKVDVERTAYHGHAIEIGEKLDVDAYDVVACASGDGLPHEVWNGLAKQRNPRRAMRKVAVVQIPCGSGNALSLNFNGTDSPSLAALAIVKGVRTPFDLVAITQGDRKFYSFLSQAVGIIAELDLGTESLRWMGSLRFTWGALVRLLGKSRYPATIAVAVESDDKQAIKAAYRNAVVEQEAARAKMLLHDDTDDDDDSLLETQNTGLPELRYGTIQDDLPSAFQVEDQPSLGNFYVGNMCWMSPDNAFFPNALPSDGKLDMVNISGAIKRSTGLRMLMHIDDGSHVDFPETSYRKVLAYRITPRIYQPPPERRLWSKFGRWLGGAAKQKVGLISVDGESVPFEPFQAEVVPRLATVLSKRPGLYEFEGPKGS